jgi:hypothetical protein
MDKFEDIKVGDKVYVKHMVNFGFHKSKGFYVLEEVRSVGKTQFTTESGARFKKLNGKRIGVDFYGLAKVEGDPKHDIFDSKNLVEDESVEMKSFKDYLNLEYLLNVELGKVSIVRRNSGISTENISKALSLLGELKECLTV